MITVIVMQVDTENKPAHTYYSAPDALARIMRHSASDMHLLTLADIHIISANSGFGQKAAFMVSSSRMYALPRDLMCVVDQYDDVARVAALWSGM